MKVILVHLLSSWLLNIVGSQCDDSTVQFTFFSWLLSICIATKGALCFLILAPSFALLKLENSLTKHNRNVAEKNIYQFVSGPTRHPLVRYPLQGGGITLDERS